MQLAAVLARGHVLLEDVPGTGKTTLAKHYRDDVNQAYVLTRVSHVAMEETYSNSFEAFPAANTYRPRRITRKPVIPGTQTAKVVGKSGEEIWTDKYGRVKVQFHWDRYGESNEKSSCWVRVSQPWAGKAWGGITIPRIGQEVIIEFMEGDPDLPIVVGRVYNGINKPPFGFPAAPWQLLQYERKTTDTSLNDTGLATTTGLGSGSWARWGPRRAFQASSPSRKSTEKELLCRSNE